MDVQQAVRHARQLVAAHGLTGWTVVVTRAKRQAGVCRFATRQIGLSGPLTQLHDEAEVHDTILHEIAHALVGPRHGHDEVWRATARSIGCTGLRCSSPDAAQVPTPWVGVCAQGHSVGRHRRPTRVVSCARCRPGFSVEVLLEWRHHGRLVPMHPNYTAELAAILGSGARPGSVPVGGRVRIIVPGRFHGREGRVVARGRSQYRVQSGAQVLRVAFAGVEPA